MKKNGPALALRPAIDGTLREERLIAEKVDVAGRHGRQIELCALHCQIVIERERALGLRFAIAEANSAHELSESASNGLIKRKGAGCEPAPRSARRLIIDFAFLASLTLELLCP